jgi:steroid delta-isomerase-like uncharacterized protein
MDDDDWLQAYFDAARNRDADRMLDFMAEDASYEDVATGIVNRGREAIAAFLRQSLDIAADLELDYVDGCVCRDRYTFEWVMAGTHTGPGASGLAPTNRRFSVRGISTGRRSPDGHISEHRDYWNLADYLRQLGLFPSPEP